MAQADIGPLTPTETTGSELAVRLRTTFEAMKTLHSGNSRPSYALPGTLWLNTSSSPWTMMVFTGTVDAPLLFVNPTTGALSLNNLTGDVIASNQVRAGSSGQGSASFVPGNAAYTGYAQFLSNVGTRAGYIGQVENGGNKPIPIHADNGNWFQFSGARPKYGTTEIALITELNSAISGVNSNKVTTGDVQTIAKKVVKGHIADAMTGSYTNADFEIQAQSHQSTARLAFHIPGTVAGNFGLDLDGGLKWAPSGSGPFLIYHSGNFSPNAYATNGRADDLQQQVWEKFNNTRLTNFGYSTALSFNSAASGYVITGYQREAGQAGDVRGLHYAQIQSFSPSRGWVAAYNA